jgi:NADH-quinone oxidoreductase subunit A
MNTYFGSYTTVGVLIAVGIGFIAVAFTANKLIRPARPRRAEKFMTYECGIDPVGVGWSQTQIRYYIFAFLFVIFDVESVFLFPWALIFSKAGYRGTALAEMAVFIAFLAVGLLYAWKKKVLEWV